MGRIRIVFVLVAVALLVPLMLLVRRALESVEVEREVRHRTVAERVFDEMERSLSDFLREEEERAPGDYRFYVRDGSALRSPLSVLPEPDFVVGHFQIDPDGSFHTPLQPRDPSLARARGDWQPGEDQLKAVRRVLEIATAQWSDQAEALRRSWVPEEGVKEKTTSKQAPGTTVELKKDGRALENEARHERKASAAYDAIQSLNRAVADRADRRRKVAKLEEAGEFEEAVATEVTSAFSESDLDLFIAQDQAAPAPAASGAAIGESAFSSKGLASEASGGRVPQRRTASPPESPKIHALLSVRRSADSVDPMIGRLGSDGTLILWRTVFVGNEGLRQGLVIDVPSLAQSLEAETLGRGSLPGAELHFTTAVASELPVPSDLYLYRHRFAEPYDALLVELRLASLGDVAGSETVYALSILLVVVGAVGLFALYRTVAVAVGFSERRSNFVAAVTHELKTPLTAIRMYGEMLRDGIVLTESKRSEYYRTITTESERLSRLIDNVLEFSRLEKGTREMNLMVGDLGSVIEEAVDWLRPHAEKEGFALVVEAAPSLPPVRFDRDALVQVVFNLVDNALKYARDATDKRILVQCQLQGDEVALLVRDMGPGVPARHLARLFEPFYRGEDELTRRTQGTGIGLALVKGLTERMGAGISGRNADEGGFEVRIGFQPAPGDAETAPA